MNYFNMNSIIYLQYTTLQLSLLDQNPNLWMLTLHTGA